MRIHHSITLHSRDYQYTSHRLTHHMKTDNNRMIFIQKSWSRWCALWKSFRTDSLLSFSVLCFSNVCRHKLALLDWLILRRCGRSESRKRRLTDSRGARHCWDRPNFHQFKFQLNLSTQSGEIAVSYPGELFGPPCIHFTCGCFRSLTALKKYSVVCTKFQ